MEQKKLLLIYNPAAGRGRVTRCLSAILQKFCAAGYETTVYPLISGLHAESVLKDAAKQDYDLVVCCGGDGTLHHTLNGLMKMSKRPHLGYIPCGSTNDFAASLNLPHDLESACDAIVNGNPKPLDIGNFSGEYFCYVAAFGAFAAVSYETPQNVKNAVGHLAYIIEGIKQLPFGQKFPARIEVDGVIYEEDFLFCSISNSTYIGGFALDKCVDADLHDGKFEVLLIRAPESIVEGNNIIAHLLAHDFNNEYIHLLHADTVNVHSAEPLAWTLDGEFGGSVCDAAISVSSGAVNIIL